MVSMFVIAEQQNISGECKSSKCKSACFALPPICTPEKMSCLKSCKCTNRKNAVLENFAIIGFNVSESRNTATFS